MLQFNSNKIQFKNNKLIFNKRNRYDDIKQYLQNENKNN